MLRSGDTPPPNPNPKLHHHRAKSNHSSSVLCRRPVVVPLLLPALLEGLHLEFTPLAICLCCGTRQPRPSDRQETYLVLTSPPVLLLIEAVIQLGVLICIETGSVLTPPKKSPKSNRTCTTSAEDSGIPNSSQHRSGHLEFGHRRTTHQVHRHPRRFHQACDRSLHWTS